MVPNSKSTYTNLDVPVNVSELFHAGESLDASPASVGEEVHRGHHVGGGRETQEEV